MDDLLTTDACSLPTEARPLRLSEFGELFADHLRAQGWSGDRLCLELAGPPGLTSRVRDLTAREAACCSFFEFAVTGNDDALVLEVGVSAAHRDVLASLAELAARAGAPA